MDKLQALEAMFTDVTGPSRELDCRIWSALVSKLDYDLALLVVPNHNEWQAPYYTASIDAALSLVEASAVRSLTYVPSKGHMFSFRSNLIRVEATHLTAPLAICLAVVEHHIKTLNGTRP